MDIGNLLQFCSQSVFFLDHFGALFELLYHSFYFVHTQVWRQFKLMYGSNLLPLCSPSGAVCHVHEGIIYLSTVIGFIFFFILLDFSLYSPRSPSGWLQSVCSALSSSQESILVVKRNILLYCDVSIRLELWDREVAIHTWVLRTRHGAYGISSHKTRQCFGCWRWLAETKRKGLAVVVKEGSTCVASTQKLCK